MNTEFIQFLTRFLKETGKLYLPGLGQLVWSYHKVSVVPQNRYAAPAGYYSTFKQIFSGETEDFIQRISVEMQCSIKEAESYLNALVQEMREGLSKQGHYKLSDLGTFHKSNEKIYFVPDNVDWSPEHYGLPVIPVTPIEYTEDEKSVLVQSPLVVHALEGEKKTSWTLWETILALMLSAFILFVIARIVEAFSALEGKSQGTEESHRRSSDTDTKGLNGGLKKEVWDVDEDFIDLPNWTDQETQSPVFGKKCVIIVGSFLKKSNADALEQKVKSLGYPNTYREEQGRFHRIGIAFDCLTEDLYRKLFVLRGALEKEAWILIDDNNNRRE